MVSNTFYQHGAYIHWSYPNLYPKGSPFLLHYLGYNMTYEPTIHIRDLWQLVY